MNMDPQRFREQYSDRIEEQTDGCWLWTGATTDEGYGQVGIDGEVYYVHRLVVSPIPDGKQANHHCDVRACCNPDHIYIGTHVENMQDGAERGEVADHLGGLSNGLSLAEQPENICSPEDDEFSPISDRPEAMERGREKSAEVRDPLTDAEKQEVRSRYETETISQRSLADEYDVSLGYINNLVNS